MKSVLIKIGGVVLLLAFMFGLGRYTAPVKVEEKQIITKETEYITREIVKPDGTIVKETIKKDTATKENQTIVDNKKAGFKVAIIPQYNFGTKETIYGATVEKRILGNVFAGVYADTNKTVGVVVSMEF
jgi:hypothetical protein